MDTCAPIPGRLAVAQARTRTDPISTEPIAAMLHAPVARAAAKGRVPARPRSEALRLFLALQRLV